MDLVKTCSKCGEVKPVDDFHKNQRWCKRCANADRRARRIADPEKFRTQNKAWRSANPEKSRAQNRARCKAWREANTEKARALSRAKSKVYREANLEKCRAADNYRRKANPEQARAWCKAWYETNVEKIRAKTSESVNRLSHHYVIHLITRDTPIKAAYIPQSLIDLKRVQVLITRKLKELRCK